MGEIKSKTNELNKPENSLNNLKSDVGNLLKDAKDFVKNLLNEVNELNESLESYFNDLKTYSEYDDTVGFPPFEQKDIQKSTKEEMKNKKEEFVKSKDKLISDWEEVNNKKWPTYDEPVYMTTKDGREICIRNVGDRYDAHHIHPLSWGGKNEVSNVTPMHALNHQDHMGIHSTDRAYGKISNILEGKSNE